MKRLVLFLFFLFFLVCKSTQPIITEEKQEKAYLGILYIETPSGIQIAEVFPNSPASKSGLEAGDLIISANGYPVIGPYTLKENIFSLKPGSEVLIEVIKFNGKKTKLKAILEPIPDQYKHQYNIK
ncbi:MAG: PDZ domain-containing protein [Leptonema sp. (in: bacteria)]